MKKNASELEAALRGFYGTEKYHRLTMSRNLLATDGVAYLAQAAEAFWLIDEIAFAQNRPVIRDNERLQGIQFWTLKVNEDRSAQLILEEDEGEIVWSKDIPMTDFPLPSVRIWVGAGDETTKVAMLPSEY